MKRQVFYLSIQILFLLCFTQFLNGQYSKVEETMTFGIRLNDPIKMDVQKSVDKVTFNALNKSYFPYDFTISFSDLENLFPMVFERKVIVPPGYNNLFNLNIVNKDQPFQYEYKITYSIRLSNKPDLTFPYLIPVGAGKTVKLESIKNDKGETFLINYFKMASGDTVFAIRKGIVTALPDDNSDIDRIVKSFSLEILQGDGTVAIYRGLDPSWKLTHLGQTVYPGQPVGMMNTGTLILYVVAMQGNSTLKVSDISFSDQKGNIISSNLINGIEAFFPAEIIKKEMTAKEIKKYDKGNLY